MSGWKRETAAFVGLAGTQNVVEVIRGRERIVCRMARGSHLARLLITGVFGPVMSAWLLARPGGVPRPMPWLVAAGVWSLCLAMWLLFLRYLLLRPRVEIMLDSGDIHFYRFSKRGPASTLRGQEVEGFEVVQTEFQTDEGRRVTNHLVAARTRGGGRRGLCVSPDEGLMRGLAEELAHRAGKAVLRGKR